MLLPSMKAGFRVWYILSLRYGTRSNSPIRATGRFTRTIQIMANNEATFPEGLNPADLPPGEPDPTRLVWDLSNPNDKEKGHVRIYLREEPKEEDQAKSLEKNNTVGGEFTSNQPEPSHATDTADASTTKLKSAITANSDEVIEASVLQYQRQLRKTQAAKRAGAVLEESQLDIVFEDESIVVVNKPAGVLCVPGIHNNDSVANLLFARVQKQQQANENNAVDLCQDACSMAVHRLDMDTSGLVVFGKTKSAVSTLHQVFRRETANENPKKKRHNKKGNKRQKTGDNPEDNENLEVATEDQSSIDATNNTVVKEYEALVCGHLPLEIESGHIDLPLQRDVHHPPFMRVSTPDSETLARQVVDALRERNWTKLSKRNPKQSQTTFRVMGREYYCPEKAGGRSDDDLSPTQTPKLPVTRLSLTPITGRTHQLRVHCAAMGFPILGDPVYGLYGESAFGGGLSHNPVDVRIASDANHVESKNWRAPISLQKQLMKIHPPGEKDMCLHAKKLGFPHPVAKAMGVWNVPPKF
jgi:23S rRNA-/tRNA-specific pseudouridylate synthase